MYFGTCTLVQIEKRSADFNNRKNEIAKKSEIKKFLSEKIMKKTASLLVVLAAFFTMSSAFSAETPKFGADRHVARGMACASCHGPDGKSPEYPDQETCLKCHQKDALVEKTKAIGPVNPHKAPHNGECTLCHLQHEAPVNYCAECHPQFKFNPN